jgi:predicted DNA-binding protein YlxM (UPF0122 family)
MDVHADDVLAQRIRLNQLYDVYAPLLTDKQREAFELHECSDLSLAEMSERLGVTRQAAHDLVLRARERLEDVERTLGLLARISRLEARVAELEVRLGDTGEYGGEIGGEDPEECSTL